MDELLLTAPQPLSVTQRTALTPGLGSGRLTVRGASPRAGGALRVRTVLCSEATGSATDWQRVEPMWQGQAFEADVTVAAGGWLRLEVELVDGSAPVAVGLVEPIGVGEVFVVAGQSYATSGHERVIAVQDPMVRAVAASVEQPRWRFAHDPQPSITERIDPGTLVELLEMLEGLDLSFPHGPHTPFVGSLWPVFADALIAREQVPVALVHAPIGGTRIAHWRPGTQLFTNLVDSVALAGDYRALLWQQGETDVALGTTTEEYVAAAVTLRSALAAASGLDRPWLPARSTHHPTSGRDPELETPIRDAVDTLWSTPGFARGADTDALRGSEHRAEWLRGAHFSEAGQRAAGSQWAEAVGALLDAGRASELSPAPGARTP